jgi:hypothetical protein
MSLHFKLVKTDVTTDPTPFTYAKWIVVIVLVGVSVSSFITQSLLALKDRFFAGDIQPAVELVQKATTTREMGLGSDDGIYQEGNIEAEKDSFKKQYSLTNVTQFPRVTAKGFLAADLKTGEIILEQGEDLVAPVASVTKLMTALVAREKMDLQKVAIVSRDSFNTFGSEGELRLGEKIRLYDLMHPLLMESSNDGAEVITEAYDKGRDAFMAEMNKKAKEYEEITGGKCIPLNVSNIQHQKSNTECGIYSIFFVTARLCGIPYKKFRESEIKDENVNKFRKYLLNDQSAIPDTEFLEVNKMI